MNSTATSASRYRDDQGLRAAFEAFGPVEDAKVINDRDTGRSRGFGFVTFASDLDADKAIEEMNGAVLDGRTLNTSGTVTMVGGEAFPTTTSIDFVP